MSRPSVSQAQSWRPDALGDVADAWDHAAGRLRLELDDMAREVLATRDVWTGSAADEARAKIDEITSPGNTLARLLFAAAAAARNGRRRIEAARAEALAAVEECRALGYDVGDDGTVHTPSTIPDLVRLACGGDAATAQLMMSTRTTELTAEVSTALDRLGAADADTAREVEAAFSGADRRGAAAGTAPAGVWTLTPAEVVAAWPQMSQDRIATQLAAMSEQERAHLVEAAPLQVGNTDGVPWELRMAANRLNIADAILAQRRVVDLPEEDKITAMLARRLDLDAGSTERVWLAAHADPVFRAGLVAAHDREANARIDFYDGLLSDIPDPTNRTDTEVTRQIIAFDPERSSFVELSGDLASASGVGVLVPGLGTTVAGSAADTETSRRFVAAGHGDVAMITYLGGPFPDGDLAAGIIDAGKGTYALDMAPRLVAFSEDVQRTLDSTGRDIPVTYVGHSYGGSILGTAEHIGLTADRTFYVAAAGAGVGVHHPGDWHNGNPDVVRFSMTAPGDWIQAVQGLPLSPHGADPDDMPGVVQLDTGLRLTGAPMIGPAAHSAVLNEPSDAWHNILAVITGDWADLDVKSVEPPR
ncbi:WXG100 family type VII secretion target [soil metagenome]